MNMNDPKIAAFREKVWDYFFGHELPMSWRENPEPYYVLVSELMLQQTQVPRVIPKFHEFTLRFPTILELGRAPLSEVLKTWNGLGYNRRAKFLWQAAQMVELEFGGVIPDSYENLVKLPGVGPNTAGAILAYAYNQPVVFVETNIRTVYFHHFFMDQETVSDKELRDVVQATLDHEHPREFYWGLMDYGSYLKQTVGARLHQSKHYKKQSPLAGSLREMRGRILRTLTARQYADMELRNAVNADERYDVALRDLANEGMIGNQNGKWCLTEGVDIR
jgi:A/G-specific adenine glycosylase